MLGFNLQKLKMSDKIDNALGQKVHGRKLENLLDLVKHTESSNHGKTIFNH